MFFGNLTIFPSKKKRLKNCNKKREIDGKMECDNF